MKKGQVNLLVCVKMRASEKSLCCQKAVLNCKIYWNCEMISPKEAAEADLLLAPFKTGLSDVLESLV